MMWFWIPWTYLLTGALWTIFCGSFLRPSMQTRGNFVVCFLLWPVVMFYCAIAARRKP